jgi:hypothetical protein
VAVGSALSVAGAALAAYNVRTVPVTPTDPPPVPAADPVSVLLPVRDEAHRLAPCLRALLAQRGVADLEILVLDDGSTDGTAALVRAAEAAEPRLRLLTGDDLPAGWLGKPHACAQLAAAARGRVLVFVDADVVLAPDAVASAVAMLRDRGLDLVSPLPRQVAASSAERLVQPLLAWMWLSTLPVRAAERSRRPSTAAATGQFLVMDAAAYGRLGGHGAVRGEVLDDIGLARAVKRAGGRAGMVVGAPVARCRMYAGRAELRAGYDKWLWAAFGPGRGVGAAVVAGGGLLLAHVAPALAALRGSRVGLLGYAAGVAGRVMVARRTGDRAWPDALAQPVSAALAAALLASSVRGRRRGTLRWKGRPVHLGHHVERSTGDQPAPCPIRCAGSAATGAKGT